MTIDDIIKFATDNEVEASELRLAAHVLGCKEIQDKLESCPNREYSFENTNFIPSVICCAFDEPEEVMLNKAYMDNENKLRFEIIDNNGETYDLSQAELTCIEYVASNIIINE